jgi:pimeloyl-ACP methyl ester carboxylesterase
MLGPLGLSSRLYGFATEFATASGYAALTFDNRGCGRSQAPSKPWSIRTMAQDAIAVLDAAGVRRAHVCGPSLGGFIAQELAIGFPQRIGGLVLSSTTAGWPRPDLMPWRHAVLGVGRMLRKAGRPAAPEERVRALLAIMVSPQFAGDVEVGSPAWRVAARLADEPRPQGILGQALAGATHVGWPRLAAIRAPTQVQHGTADRVVPFRAGRQLARRLPDATLIPFEDAGHALILERAEEVAHVTLGFLRRHDHLLGQPFDPDTRRQQ